MRKPKAHRPIKGAGARGKSKFQRSLAKAARKAGNPVAVAKVKKK